MYIWICCGPPPSPWQYMRCLLSRWELLLWMTIFCNKIIISVQSVLWLLFIFIKCVWEFLSLSSPLSTALLWCSLSLSHSPRSNIYVGGGWGLILFCSWRGWCYMGHKKQINRIRDFPLWIISSCIETEPSWINPLPRLFVSHIE